MSYVTEFVKDKLQQQGIKSEDIPPFDDCAVASFFGHLYTVYTSHAHEEVLWQSARDPLKVAYSKKNQMGLTPVWQPR